MKKVFILAAAVLVLASCSNERSKTLSDYEESVSFQESLTKKVEKGQLDEKTIDDEYEKEENEVIVRNGEDAKRDLMEVKDLLTDRERGEFADLVLREKRNQHKLLDIFIAKKKAAKEAKEDKEDKED